MWEKAKAEGETFRYNFNPADESTGIVIPKWAINAITREVSEYYSYLDMADAPGVVTLQVGCKEAIVSTIRD